MRFASLLGRPFMAVAVLLAGAGRAFGQSQTVFLPPNPTVIHATNSVTIPGAFSFTPGSVVQNGLQGNPCNPGACYDAAITVRANQKWQLQVTLNPAPNNFGVTWVKQRTPTIITQPLSPGTWVTLTAGTGATPGQALSFMFNANRTTGGPGGQVPTAAQVAAVLSYRVIAAP